MLLTTTHRLGTFAIAVALACGGFTTVAFAGTVEPLTPPASQKPSVSQEPPTVEPTTEPPVEPTVPVPVTPESPTTEPAAGPAVLESTTRSSEPTESAEPTPPLSEVLRVTFALGGTNYVVGQRVTLTLFMTNHGDSPLTGIVAACGRGQTFQQLELGASWGDLLGEGATIPARQGGIRTVDGTVPPGATDLGTVEVSCAFGVKPLGTDVVTAGVQIRVLGGAVVTSSGQVFADADGDGAFDDGEGVAGIAVGLLNPDNAEQVATATTGNAGEVVFTQPVGRYLVRTYGAWRGASLIQIRECVVVICRLQWRLRVVAVPPETTAPTTPPAPTPPPPQGGNLPATGAGVAWPSVIGLFAVALGGWLVLVGRRRDAVA